jgi:Na+-translocating ferredoxin:NAD+ oxidoreductase RnfD subunit
MVAIGSKFLIRFRGKHIFNPTNLGIVVVILFTRAGWISTGQWGNTAIFAFLAACLGTWVVTSAFRFDVAAMFLVTYCGLLFSRALWLGDPLSIPLHQISNGSLLIFAFFMISDPKTTPDSIPGRIVLATLVACLAYHIRYTYYTPNALIYALALTSPIVPAINSYIPHFTYRNIAVQTS